MKKRDSGIWGTLVIALAIVSSMFFLSGCDDSELEQRHIQLKSDLARTQSYNTSLEARLEKATKDNNSINKVLAQLRENNKGLNVSLAKSELEFSKKHKAELEAGQKKLDSEREALKQKQKSIEKAAYENAEKTVSNKYMGVIAIVLFLLALVLILWFLNNRKNQQLIRDKEEKIKKIISEKKGVEEALTAKEKNLNDLGNKIKELERMQKAGSKNQVVSKIEEYNARRERKLNRLEDNGYGK